MPRTPLVPPAVGLVLCAAWALGEATRLHHNGAPALLATAAVLAGAAVALLAWRQLWAWAFALLFFSVVAASGIAVAAVAGWQAVHGSGGDWAGLQRLALLVIATLALLTGLFSSGLTVLLVSSRGVLGRAREPLEWTLSVAGALGAMGLVAWLVGHQYWHQRLLAQNECLSGAGRACYVLVHATDKFTTAQRRAFARAGCEAADDSVCRELLPLLDASHVPASPEVRAVAARCEAGQLDLCHRLARHLLKVGDQESAAGLMERTCARDARWCEPVALTAQEAGLTACARRLLEDGCGRDEARACRSLLRVGRAWLGPEGEQELELKTCLIGDVNDCRPLMNRDLHRTCALVCDGTTESRMHTCGYCAQEAAAAGEPALAESWLAGTCARGYRWGCTDLARLRERPLHVQARARE